MPATLEVKPKVGTPQSSRKQPIAHRSRWHVAGECVLLSLAFIAGLELVFNACGIGQEEILEPDAKLGTRHIAGKPVVWRMEGFAVSRFNSQGMRDIERSVAKVQGVTRIALLGDSATEGLQVPLDETYGRKLEKLLNFLGNGKYEVLNFACSAYSTGQEVLQYESQVRTFKPNIVVLLYNRGDAVENIRKPFDLKAEPRPYFYLDGTGELKQDNAVLEANAAALKPNPTIDFLRRNSRIFGVLSHANLNLSINEPVYRKLRGWILAPFTNKNATPPTAQNVYPPQDGWAVTSKLLSRLNQSVKADGAKLLIVGFPNVVNDTDFDKQLADLQGLSKKEAFDFLDLTPVFRWNPNPMSMFIKYHFSSKGHKFVAERIATHLSGTEVEHLNWDK